MSQLFGALSHEVRHCLIDETYLGRMWPARQCSSDDADHPPRTGNDLAMFRYALVFDLVVLRLLWLQLPLKTGRSHTDLKQSHTISANRY